MTNLKTFAYALVVCVGLVPARAQAQSFDTQQLRLVPNQQDNYFGLHSARTLGFGSWEAGLVLSYANDPLVIVDDQDERVGSIVSDLAVADVMFAIGVLDQIELGLDVPLILLQDGDDLPADGGVTAPNAGVGFGDIHLMAKLSLWNRDTKASPGGTAFAIAIDAQLPTGERSDFRGEGLRIEPRAVLDYAFPRSLRLSLQVGYLVRPETELLGAEVDDSLTFGLGADLPLDQKLRWHLIGEADAKVSVLASSIDAAEVPVELLIGGRYIDDSGVMVEAAGGFGLNAGFGTPDYRVLIGVSYRSPSDPDPDGDGITGDADRCPEDPEDPDDFEDGDGCSDPDNDGDTILDSKDECPNDAEDRDGFGDDDGCPDPDNDQDGVLDTADACRDEPEDTDGFEDEDGCPDPDNDGDKVADIKDGCPNEPDDIDGFEDEDGCPDPDNDKDGLLDAIDECPNEAEDFDGFEDDDGCPEAGSGLVKLTCDKIDIADRVYFDTGSDRIQPRSFGLLEQVASVLKSASYVKGMRIEGHTDDRGKDTANLELSARRAASVMRFLVEHGVAAERLTSEGFGETNPIASNKTTAGRGQNRRVEFLITEQDSRCAKP
jgi:outer membrane protein OmpA-like peptidoglycan-associated protein